ncbi:MAG: hypothetical protein ACR2HP_11750 [Ilumatobacteraceae bacterium]
MRPLLVLGVALVAAAGCNGGDEDTASRAALVYTAAIRQAMSDQPPPADPEVLPVVYVVAVGETPIAADIQAEVTVLLRDENLVRFADERAQAVLADIDAAPVRDEGTLVAFGELPPDAASMDVEVEVYRSDDDWSKAVLTVEERSSEWSVTSSSVLPD